MAEVFGTIGTNQVVLNNAATEATLRQLLQATVSTGKQGADNVKNLAQKTGLDPVKIAESNKNISLLGKTSMVAGSVVGGLSAAATQLTSGFNNVLSVTEKLTQGTAQASDLFSSFTKFGGIVGLVATGAQKLAQFQEQQLSSYRELTKAGVNFGGSLTDIRLAASNAYMTMGDFTKLIKSNSENFAKMGGTANDGAIAFSKVAAELQRGEIGRQLRALGYTSAESAESLTNYIAMTGGRSKKEMENTQGLSKAAGEYMMQLDSLAQITGKTKEQQEQALKEAAANQAYQSYLNTLDEDGKKKANAAMAEASAKGGKGAADALMSQLLGLPPMTKAAQQFTAIAPEMAAANNKMAAAVKDGSKGIEDVKKASDELGVAATRTKEQLGVAMDAQILAGGEFSGTMSQISATANRNQQQGIKDTKDAYEQRKKVEAEQLARTSSSAAAAAETEKRLFEIGQTILNKVLPAFEAYLLPYVNQFAEKLNEFVTWIDTTPGVFTNLLEGAKLLAAGFVALKVAQAAYAAKKFMSTGGKSPGHPGAPPLIVRDISGLGSAGPGTPGSAGGKPGGLTKRLAGGLGGVLGGLALDYAGEKLKESGHEKLGAGADIGGAAITGAGMGAMLGPVGAALGAAAGGAYGLYQNWGTLFGSSGKQPSKPEAAKAIAEKAKEETATSAVTTSETEKENPLEKMSKQLERLNTQTTEIIRYLRDTAENTKRTIDATKQLGGNLFPQP